MEIFLKILNWKKKDEIIIIIYHYFKSKQTLLTYIYKAIMISNI